MFSPIFHIRAIADIDITERSMSIIAGTTQHGVFSIYLLREKYPVAIEWKESILALEKLFEVKRICNADSRTMIAVAPGNPVTILNPSYTRIIFILRLNHIRIACLELYRFVIDIPIDAVLTETGKDIHLHCLVVTTEYSGKSIFKRHYGTIKNTV